MGELWEEPGGVCAVEVPGAIGCRRGRKGAGEGSMLQAERSHWVQAGRLAHPSLHLWVSLTPGRGGGSRNQFLVWNSSGCCERQLPASQSQPGTHV